MKMVTLMVGNHFSISDHSWKLSPDRYRHLLNATFLYPFWIYIQIFIIYNPLHIFPRVCPEYSILSNLRSGFDYFPICRLWGWSIKWRMWQGVIDVFDDKSTSVTHQTALCNEKPFGCDQHDQCSAPKIGLVRHQSTHL